ncbi:hypothetical protein ONZ51_g12394 [Trametes cubensis]|uniref:Uncharacterized protein n=1 Tax=Trametes cubensis TaxID=1111947 RepID=A0AAD7TFV3_9APHY|nr:hypothetical protein ONZ51_g12394 [Trametes cubensis]
MTIVDSSSTQQAQLQDFIETSEGHERFAASFQSADPTEDIQALAVNIREIKHAFRELGDHFGVLDKRMKRRKFSFLRQTGDTSLRAQWKKLHTITNKNIENAKSFRDHFSGLSDDIRLFSIGLREKVESAKERDDSLLNTLSEAYGELGKLEARLGTVSKELSDFSSACIANLTAGAREAGRFFIKFAPNAVHSAMASVIDAVPQGIDAARKRAEVANLQAQIRETQERIAKLRRHRGAVRELAELMQRANVVVDNVSFRIDALSDIWGHLNRDMVELNSMLNTVVSGDVVSQVQDFFFASRHHLMQLGFIV